MFGRWMGALTALCALVCLLGWSGNKDSTTKPATKKSAKRKVPRRAAIGAYILGPRSLIAGSSASYRVAVHWARAPGVTGPLPNASVSLTLASKPGKGKGRVRPIALRSGRTDASGSAKLRFAVPRVKTGDYQLVVAVRSSLGTITERRSISVFPGGRILLTTDKTIYQPSQTIHIRALALRSIDLKPVARRPIRIQVKDPKGNVVYLKAARTSTFGVASLDFKLADEINLGSYAITAWTQGADSGGRTSRAVQVKRYVLPKFKVTVETDRAYYRPGDQVRGTVRCRYFFGKPVVGAKVTLDVRSRIAGPATIHWSPVGRTDDQGRHTFKLTLPDRRVSGAGTGELRVLAKVRDTANHLERGDRSVPLTKEPLRLSVVPENKDLSPGVRNRLHVIAGYPDGKPAKGARLELTSGKLRLRGRTDALGVATFTLMPHVSLKHCPDSIVDDDDDESSEGGGMVLSVSARDALGQRGKAKICAPVARRGSVLVRPVRSLVEPGQVVEMTMLASPARRFRHGVGDQIFMDVVKAGQTLATYTGRLRRGRARFVFQPDPALFGLLELRGYRVSRTGERESTSRMVYVDHPGQLKITAKPDKTTYRPGQRARIRFQVVDSRTGDGVQAALGLLAVDEAVVAMGGLQQQGSPKLFFTLASQARGDEQELRAHPGGRDLEHWVISEQEKLSRRARAADVLLAAVQPADSPVWETNPWKERRQAWEEQAPRLIQAAKSFMERHSVGKRTAKGWRFHPNLVPRMARAKAVEDKQVRDPWQRTVRPWHLRRIDPSFTFAPLAKKLAPRRLERIYTVLSEVWEQLKLPREVVRKLKREQWPLRLPRGLLARLVKMGKLKRHEIVDPWGRPYRVVLNSRTFINPYYTGLVSRYHICSAGPDSRFGTKDDLGPSGPRVKLPMRCGRHLASCFGRDTALGTDVEDALGGLIGNQIGEAYGVGGLGLVGTGRGGGGTGEGTIGIGSMGTIGHGGGPGMPARVRSHFPETLLWHPELITDAQGRASLDVNLADSITTWKLVATGSTRNGLLGSATADIKVFQDFFVDIDLPVALTQGDRISVPVSVYNYLKTPQKITLRLKRGSWFSPSGALEQTIELGPSQVGVRYFPIVARRVGRQDLTVHASATGASGTTADAVRRSTLVEPDGVEHAIAVGGSLRGSVSHELAIPASSIAGTRRLLAMVYPGPMSQTLKGMEGMLRKPYGCFEQTSSTTYPNVLILDYLRRSGKLTKNVERRAKQLINEGYQRLISFEVDGGGFSWFGKAPAHRILTAYGLMEFFDMSKVHPVDPKLITRTQRWLAAKQNLDGSWDPDSYNIADGATNNFTKDKLRITAYIANALRHTRYHGKVLSRALTYVRKNASKAKDPYTLALLGNLMAPDADRAARGVMERLWRQRRATKKGLVFEAPRSTLTYGAGRSGSIETTALAVLAFLSRRSGATPRGLDRVIDTIVASKDSFGSWYSTQATILSLRTLLLQQQRNRSRPAGKVQILVDGRERGSVKLVGKDQAHQVDLTPYARTGRHRVALRFAGKGNLQYQVVGRYWLPRRHRMASSRTPIKKLAIQTYYSRQQVKRGGKLRLNVVVRNNALSKVDMPMVTVSLPPGFAIHEKDLTSLVRRGRADKVQRVGSRALIYLTKLDGKQRLHFSVGLRGKYPLRVQARPSVVYEYYRPENRAESKPRTLQVL